MALQDQLLLGCLLFRLVLCRPEHLLVLMVLKDRWLRKDQQSPAVPCYQEHLLVRLILRHLMNREHLLLQKLQDLQFVLPLHQLQEALVVLASHQVPWYRCLPLIPADQRPLVLQPDR